MLFSQVFSCDSNFEGINYKRGCKGFEKMSKIDKIKERERGRKEKNEIKTRWGGYLRVLKKEEEREEWKKNARRTHE